MPASAANIESSLVMVVTSSCVLKHLERKFVSPEQLARAAKEDRNKLAASFKKLANVTLNLDFHSIQVVRKVGSDLRGDFLDLVRSLSQACAEFRAARTDLGTRSKLHAGTDVGPLLVKESRYFGETTAAAVCFAEQAMQEDVLLVVARECIEALRDTEEEEIVASERIEVRRAIRKTREIVRLSSDDVGHLLGKESARRTKNDKPTKNQLALELRAEAPRFFCAYKN